MASFKEIDDARKLLGLFDRATIPELEKSYKSLLLEWHPDKNPDNQEEANEMTADIIKAYKILMEYFMNYKIPFTKSEVIKYSSPEDWWASKFGSGPLWSDKK